MMRFCLIIFFAASALSLYSQPNLELMVGTGHRSSISHAEYTSDERLAITSGDDGMIVWDVANGLELKKFKREVRIEIPFSIPGSPHFGSVHDGVVRLFDAYTLQERIIANTSLYFICKSITVDQAGRYMYMGGQQYDANNYRAILYKVNLQSGQVQVISQIRAVDMGLPNPDYNSNIGYENLTLTPDGSLLMAKYVCWNCTDKAFFQVFNTISLSVEKKFNASYAGFASNNIVFTSIAQEIAKDKYRFPITFLQYPGMTPIKTFDKNAGSVFHNFQNRNFILDTKGKKFIMGNRYAVTEIDLSKMTWQQTLVDTSSGYNTLAPALSPLSKQILRASTAGAVEQVNPLTKTTKSFGGGKPFTPETVTAHSSKKIVSMYSHMYRSVQLIDLSKDAPKIYNYFTDYATAIAWSPSDSKGIICRGAYNNSEIGVFNADHPEQPPVYVRAPELYGSINNIQWSTNGKRFVVGPGYGVYVWDAQTMQQIKKLPGNEKFIGGAVGINEDGSLVAVNFLRQDISNPQKSSKFLAVYNVSDGRKLWEIPSPVTGNFYMIAFVTNNKLACITDNNTYFYNVQNGSMLATVYNPGTNYKASLSSDKKFVYTSTNDGMVKYEVETGRSITKINASNSLGSLPHEFVNDFAAAVNPDNSIHFFDLRNQRDAGKLFTFMSTQEYAFVNSDNYFEGSDQATKTMYFIRENKIVPLQSLFEIFYTPHIVQQVFARTEPAAPVIPVNNVKAPPVTTLSYKEITRNLEVVDDDNTHTVTTGFVSITVKAESVTDAISEIRLYHNGKQIIQDARNLIVTDNTEETKSFNIELQPGENTFTAISLNSQRTESMPAKLVLNYRLSKKPDNDLNKNDANNGTNTNTSAPTLHVVIVGIDQYKNAKYNLNYAVADAEGFSQKIKQSCGSLYSNCKPYFITNQSATKDKIVSTLQQISADAQPQDVFVFYYAGHGVLNESVSKEFYLVPHDVTQLYGNDAGLSARGLSAQELQNLSSRIKAQKQLYILDACQSAGALQNLAMRGAAEEKAIAQLARSTGTHWLTAAGSEQFATEFDKLGHGAFTYVLLNGLTGEAALENGTVTVNSLKAYLETKVPEITEQYKGSAQYPASYGFGNDFPVMIKKKQ